MTCLILFTLSKASETFPPPPSPIVEMKSKSEYLRTLYSHSIYEDFSNLKSILEIPNMNYYLDSGSILN